MTVDFESQQKFNDNSQMFNEAHKARIKKQEQNAKTFPWMPFLAGTIDSASLGRNTASAFFHATAAATVTTVGLIVGGLAGLICGGILTGDGISKTREAIQDKDDQEVISKGLYTGGAASYAVLSPGLLTVGIAPLLPSKIASNLMMQAGTIGFTAAGFAFYAMFLAWGAYNWHTHSKFGNQLEKFYQNGDATPKQLAQAMQWIKDQIQAGDNPKELNKNWNKFASNTSEEFCQYVRETINEDFIDKVKIGDLKALREAAFICKEGLRANAKQMVKDKLTIVVCSLGIITLILSLLVMPAFVVPLLFAIGAVLWFIFDLNYLTQKFGDLFCGKSEIPPPKKEDQEQQQEKPINSENNLSQEQKKSEIPPPKKEDQEQQQEKSINSENNLSQEQKKSEIPPLKKEDQEQQQEKSINSENNLSQEQKKSDISHLSSFQSKPALHQSQKEERDSISNKASFLSEESDISHLSSFQGKLALHHQLQKEEMQKERKDSILNEKDSISNLEKKASFFSNDSFRSTLSTLCKEQKQEENDIPHLSSPQGQLALSQLKKEAVQQERKDSMIACKSFCGRSDSSWASEKNDSQ